MIIHSIELRNFLSHEDSRVNFDLGVNLITGKNGAGKSSIIDGIKFALFGDSRGGAVADMVRNGSSEAFVKLDFSISSDHYTVTRTMSLGRSGIKSRDATLIKNNTEIARTVSAVNRAMEDILGITEDLFLNSVFVQQGEITSLVSENKSVRERTFSHILGLNFLQQLAQDIQDSTKMLRGRVDAMSSAPKNLQEAIEKIEATQNEILATRNALHESESREGPLKSALEAAKSRFQDAKATVQKIESDDRKRKELQGKIDAVSMELAEKKRRISDMERKSSELRGQIDSELLGMQLHIQRYFDLLTILDSREKLMQNFKEQQERLESISAEVRSLLPDHESFKLLSEKLVVTKEKIKTLERGEETFSLVRNSYDQSISRIQRMNGELSEIKGKILGILDQDADEVKVNTIRNGLQGKILSIDGRIAQIKAEAGRIFNERKKISASLSELGSGNVCPLCKQPLTNEHMDRLTSDYKNEDSRLLEELEKLTEEKSRLERERKKLAEELDELSSQEVQNYLSLMKRISAEEQELDQHRKRMSELENDHLAYQSLKSELESITSELEAKNPSEVRYISLQAAMKEMNGERIRNEISRLGDEISLLRNEKDSILRDLGFIPDDGTKDKLQKSLRADRELSALMGSIGGEREAERTIAARLADLERDMDMLSGSVSGLPAAIEALEKATNDLRMADDRWQSHISEASSYRERLKGLEAAMDSSIRERTAAEQEVARLENLREAIARLDLIRTCFDRDGIQKTIRRDSAVYVTNMMREYSMAFNLNFDDIRVGEDMSIEVSQNGNVESIDMLSGGERTALAIALRLALVKYVNDSIKTMVMDEPTVFLDEDRRQNLTDILQYSFNGDEIPIPQMIIVSHHSELRSVSNNIFEVSKVNGKSFVREAE